MLPKQTAVIRFGLGSGHPKSVALASWSIISWLFFVSPVAMIMAVVMVMIMRMHVRMVVTVVVVIILSGRLPFLRVLGAQYGKNLFKFGVRGFHKRHRLTNGFSGLMTGGALQTVCNFQIPLHVFPIVGYPVSQPDAALLRFVHEALRFLVIIFGFSPPWRGSLRESVRRVLTSRAVRPYPSRVRGETPARTRVDPAVE